MSLGFIQKKTISSMAIVATLVATASATGCLGSSDSFDDEATDQTLRYIPSYANACRPEDRETYLGVRTLLEQAATSYEWKVADTMEMCNENSCMPCSPEDNPMLQVLRSHDSWGSGELTSVSTLLAPDFVDLSNLDAGPLEVYFARALDYPWRKLLLGTPAGAQGSTQVSLAQGIHRSCTEGTACNEYRIAVESLETSCESLAVSTPATLSESGELTATGQSSSEFGFEVPITASLPDPSSFGSVPEIEDWLAGVAHVTVEMSDVEVQWSQDGSGGYCATVRGKVDADTFDSIAESPTAVDAYADADGHISTVLSLQLSPTTIISG